MADDTRDSNSQAPIRPKGPANIMPGGTAHTAGGVPADYSPTYIDAVKSLGPDYYLNFHKQPCVRDGQLVGIPAGFVGGAVAAIARQPVWKASNYAVFTWLVVGCGSFQYCQYMRSKEKDGMRQARELMEKKRATIEAKKEARRKMKVEQAQLQEERMKEEARKKTWSYWIDKNVRFW